MKRRIFVFYVLFFIFLIENASAMGFGKCISYLYDKVENGEYSNLQCSLFQEKAPTSRDDWKFLYEGFFTKKTKEGITSTVKVSILLPDPTKDKILKLTIGNSNWEIPPSKGSASEAYYETRFNSLKKKIELKIKIIKDFPDSISSPKMMLAPDGHLYVEAEYEDVASPTHGAGAWGSGGPKPSGLKK